jgi:D-alanyl-D-alanine carboxypeptidase/D-alanyl-D-alanine-endopeptidase (penicillin-binding protein 4)
MPGRRRPSRFSLAELQRELSAHVTQPKFAAAQWGVKVVSLDSGAVLFETNAHKLLKPHRTRRYLPGQWRWMS